jgi:hypothetical protein
VNNEQESILFRSWVGKFRQHRSGLSNIGKRVIEHAPGFLPNPRRMRFFLIGLSFHSRRTALVALPARAA